MILSKGKSLWHEVTLEERGTELMDETADRFLLNIPKIKTVLPDPEDNRKRLVLLRVAEKGPSLSSSDDFKSRR